MRGAIIHAPGDVRLEERPNPTIIDPTDAIIRTVASCVCGSDLWRYRGISPVAKPVAIGHEYVGIVEQVGAASAPSALASSWSAASCTATAPARCAAKACTPRACTAAASTAARPS
ncbi:MAG: alcohol dehydrogenase catalytic domain-containing protein [Micropruina sp.]